MKIRAVGSLRSLFLYRPLIYFSSCIIYVCGCVPAAEVLRPCSTANPADICVPSEGTSLQYYIQGWDHPNSYSHCLNFL